MRLARYDEAEQVLQEALEIAEQEMAPNASPPNAGWGANIVWLARCHRMVGLLRFYTGRFEDAERALSQSDRPCQAVVRSIYPRCRFGCRTTSDGGTTIWPRS